MAFRQSNTDHPGFVSGRYYAFGLGGVSSDFLVVENTLYFVPFYAPKPFVADRFAFHISAAAGNAANEVRTGIYRSASNGTPGNLLIDNGRTVVGTGTGATTATIAVTLPIGWYWLAIIANRAPGGSATQPTLRGYTNDTTRNVLPSFIIGSTNPNTSGVGANHYRNAETVSDWTTYTLPSSATSSLNESAAGAACPALWLRAA